MRPRWVVPLLIAVLAVITLAAGSAPIARTGGPDDSSRPRALRAPVDTATDFPGTRSIKREILAGSVRPRSLASVDFDEDGTPDLRVGYEDGSHGLVGLHRGDADTLLRFAPGARQHRAGPGRSEA